MFVSPILTSVSTMQGYTHLLSRLPVAYTDVSHERLRTQLLVVRLLSVGILVHGDHVRICNDAYV